MTASVLQIGIALIAGVGIMILLAIKFRLHAFFALLIACLVTGLTIQMPLPEIIATIKDGFGNIMKSLGLIIILGTTLGVLLEHTGCTQVMANFILKKVGERNASIALSITGFIVGLPVFCDSGYIVLSGLNKSISKRSGVSSVATTVSLATGLYAVHCTVPPHPGAAAAALTINADLGKLILFGIIVSIPAVIIANIWAKYTGKKIVFSTTEEHELKGLPEKKPSVIVSFLPVIIPILLIAMRSFILVEPNKSSLFFVLNIAGEPVVALFIGVLLALFSVKKITNDALNNLLKDAVDTAGSILIIIGAGGAFGAILATAKIGDHFLQITEFGSIGILLPFLITVILKTAQGSSTVAIITAASIVQPLLPALGLSSENGKLLCVLSMGAGSMMISHANDAYFWVISRFSGMPVKTMLKVYSTVTILMSITTITVVYILSLLIHY